MAHKALAHSSECVQEGEMDGSQDSWPLAHSSESAQEREIWAHKALGLLLTAQKALKREKCGLKRLLAFCSQLRKRLRHVKIRHFLSQKVKIQHFLSKNLDFAL